MFVPMRTADLFAYYSTQRDARGLVKEEFVGDILPKTLAFFHRLLFCFVVPARPS